MCSSSASTMILAKKSDLILAKKDATDIAAVFEEAGRVAFGKVGTRRFVEPKATMREAIMGARALLARAGVEDLVVVFMAGHGKLDHDAYRFCAAGLDLGRLSETRVT